MAKIIRLTVSLYILSLVQCGQLLFMAEMRQCPGKGDLPIMGLNFSVERRNATQNYLHGDIVLSESFPRGFKMNLAIKTCNDMQDKSTCKPFLHHLALSDTCLLLKNPLPSYSVFIRQTVPPLKCPLTVGTYKVRDYALDNGLTRYMPKTDKRIYYHSRMTGTKNKREILCFEFYMYGATMKRSPPPQGK